MLYFLDPSEPGSQVSKQDDSKPRSTFHIYRELKHIFTMLYTLFQRNPASMSLLLHMIALSNNSIHF